MKPTNETIGKMFDLTAVTISTYKNSDNRGEKNRYTAFKMFFEHQLQYCTNCKHNATDMVFKSNHCKLLNDIQTPLGFTCNLWERDSAK